MTNIVASYSTLSSVANTNNAKRTNDIKTLVKYVNNEALKETPDTFKSTTKSAAASAALFEGIPLLGFLKAGKKTSSIVTSAGKQIGIKDAMKAIDNKTASALKNIFKGEGKLTNRILNYVDIAHKSKEEYRLLKTATKEASKATKVLGTGSREIIDKATESALKAADEFVLPGVNKYHDAFRKLTDAKIAASKNPASKKLQKAVTKAAEKANKLNPLAKTAAKSTGKLGKAAKFLKSSGAGVMLAFSGIFEMCGEVIPTFKELGKGKGLKQLGKSAIKVVGDTAGFIAGEQAGMAIGAAIGSVVPGVGTVVGGILGMGLGMIGSFAAGKITKAITGPTEREIAKEQQQQKLAEDMSNTDLSELKAQVMEKIQEEVNQSGELSEDSQIALQTLENIEKENPFSV